MNKTALKNFATQSRRKLIEQVQTKALLYGIDENNGLNIEEQFGQLMINGQTYPLSMKTAFTALKKQLEQKGYKQLLEEVAYTWFNRIIAIRYLEVHEYLPERVNVLSSTVGRVDPDILFEYDTMDLTIKQEEVRELINAGNTEAAYRILLVAQCNALNRILPFMFEPIQDNTELLLPDFLLDAESVIKTLVQSDELTESFAEIEVIGWLYQYYNSELKELVFEGLKKNKKIEKEDIAPATQLFTPRWIVQYMTENSLGEVWMQLQPNSKLFDKMRFYNKPEICQQKDVIQSNYSLEEIKILDPCVGSGHILIYVFELLYSMYEEIGYSLREIPYLILEKNLYGIDIDERAAQLAKFALTMKAREKLRTLFKRPLVINVFSTSIKTNPRVIDLLPDIDGEEKFKLKEFLSITEEIDILGSIVEVPNLDYSKYINILESVQQHQLELFNYEIFESLNDFVKLLKIGTVLNNKYTITITNPPYMGLKGMNEKLSNYLKQNHPNSKSDLFAVMIERLQSLTREDGYIATITMQSWMFLSVYEKFRFELLSKYRIMNLVHLDNMVMGIAFGTVASVIRRKKFGEKKGLFQYTNLDNISNDIPIQYPFENKRFSRVDSDVFLQLPSFPILYWASDEVIKLLKKDNLERVSISDGQNVTGNNDRFLRFFWEVDPDTIGKNKKWLLYAKGGSYRKWYGNLETVIDWSESSRNHYKKDKICRIIPEYLWYREGITWGLVTSGDTSFRYLPENTTFDKGGSSIFFENNEKDLYYSLGLLNSTVSKLLMKMLNSTINLQVRDVRNIPYIYEEKYITEVKTLVQENIDIVKENWDLQENSSNFTRHPLCEINSECNLLKDIYIKYLEKHTEKREKLKGNEEKLNHIFIEIYNLSSEIDKMVEEKSLSISNLNVGQVVRGLLSYFIGVITKRYKFEADIMKNIKYIQVTEKAYSESDIVILLRRFLGFEYSPNTVEENIQWLGEGLEMKKGEDAETRLRRYFLDEFFMDHCKLYQKRPIYWLVDSGKQKGLRTLIYMHRYQPDTMATIRFEHLQEIQAKYQQEIADLENRLVNPNLSATDKKKLNAEKVAFERKIEELREFDKRLAAIAAEEIEIDLDDGVKVNYEKFYRGGKGVLAKIK